MSRIRPSPAPVVVNCGGRRPTGDDAGGRGTGRRFGGSQPWGGGDAEPPWPAPESVFHAGWSDDELFAFGLDRVLDRLPTTS
jgi:hypothetical protein